MGKALNGFTVEYAYVRSVTVLPNMDSPTRPGEYDHLVSISYELKDIAYVLLDVRAVEHWITGGATRATVEEYTATVNAALPDLVAADKLELAGYSN